MSTFNEKFPELAPLVGVGLFMKTNVATVDDIEKHCLSKQRVKEAIEKFKTTMVELKGGCFDECNEEVVSVKKLEKELWLE